MKKVMSMIAAGVLATSASATHVNVLDSVRSGPGTVTWTKDDQYFLGNFVFVDSLQTLVIEAGTVVKTLSNKYARSSGSAFFEIAGFSPQGLWLSQDLG